MLERSESKFLWNLDWNLLKVFSAIVRFRGVSRAAAAMHRQQPSVSSALKRLEDYLGVTLCQRGPGGFELTEEGLILAQVCAQLESELASVPGRFDELSAEVMFQVRLIVVGNLVSPRLDEAIAGFSRRYPRAELMINVAPCTEIEARVLDNEVEIGVGPVAEVGEKLDLKFLYREQHGVVCSPGHPRARRPPENASDLAEEAFVLPGNDEAVQVVRYRERHGLGRTVAGESPNLNEVRRMVIAGMGLALLPLEFLEADLKAGRLLLLLHPDADAQDDIFVISNPRSPRRHAVARFLDLIPD